jgi:hypothetical protein
MRDHARYSPTGRGRPCGAWTDESRLRPHGTYAAVRRHQSRGETFCAPCQATPRVKTRYRPCGCPWPPLATLEQTLGLPCGYAWVESVGWVHQ